MNKLLTIYLFFAMLLALPAMADEGHTLIINGEQVEKAVVRITFDGDKVILHFDDGKEQSEDMDQVELKLDVSQTSIFSLKGAVGKKLNIEGLDPNTGVMVYDANGRVVLTALAGKLKASLSARSLSSGVYVIKAGRNIVKFIKR